MSGRVPVESRQIWEYDAEDNLERVEIDYWGDVSGHVVLSFDRETNSDLSAQSIDLDADGAADVRLTFVEPCSASSESCMP